MLRPPAAAILPRLREMLARLLEDVRTIDEHIQTLERELAHLAASDPVAQRLMAIPGIGLIMATALLATVGHIHAFTRARQFACWLGLTPSERSSTHRRRLGAISKMGIHVYLSCRRS